MTILVQNQEYLWKRSNRFGGYIMADEYTERFTGCMHDILIDTLKSLEKYTTDYVNIDRLYIYIHIDERTSSNSSFRFFAKMKNGKLLTDTELLRKTDVSLNAELGDIAFTNIREVCKVNKSAVPCDSKISISKDRDDLAGIYAYTSKYKLILFGMKNPEKEFELWMRHIKTSNANI